MEQARLFIAIALSLLVFLLWNFFFAPKKPVQQQKEKFEAPEVKEETIIPEAIDTIDVEKGPVSKLETDEFKAVRVIAIDTPLYAVEISNKGAVFKSFVLKNNIEVKEVLRCAINLTFNTMEEKCPTHDDHDYPHKQFLMYLNDCFDKNAKTVILKNNEKLEIVPEKFKAICFDSAPHYMIYPKKDIRVVLVVTFR